MLASLKRALSSSSSLPATTSFVLSSYFFSRFPPHMEKVSIRRAFPLPFHFPPFLFLPPRFERFYPRKEYGHEIERKRKNFPKPSFLSDRPIVGNRRFNDLIVAPRDDTSSLSSLMRSSPRDYPSSIHVDSSPLPLEKPSIFLGSLHDERRPTSTNIFLKRKRDTRARARDRHGQPVDSFCAR